jgi:two-component system, OmpR family, alkaline phosphatase synthesis response regulator PhoP
MTDTKGKILIVDDDEFLLEMYELKFKGSGFEVVLAHNGTEAIEKARTEEPQIILLDVVMPKIDGFDVLRALKDENISTKAIKIMLTNLGQKEDIGRGMKIGADGYIVKAHFTPSQVVSKVEQLMSDKSVSS